jgi:hypothetical protein
MIEEEKSKDKNKDNPDKKSEVRKSEEFKEENPYESLK